MKKKLKPLLFGWMIHSLVVLLFINLSFVVRYIDNLPYRRTTPWENFIQHTFVKPDFLIAVLVLLFIECSYQFFFDKFRLSLFILVSVLVGFVCSLIVLHRNFGDDTRRVIQPELIFYIACYSSLYAVVRDYTYRTRNKKDIQLKHTKGELDALKAQLNPHFLFNTLNYLYGTALREQAEQTAAGIDELAEMMRYTITGMQENFVPLKIELDFIKRYIALQRARLPERENIHLEIILPDALPEQRIAPMLLLPFIENAFKYGISMEEPSYVNLKIGIEKHELTLEVCNSVFPSVVEATGTNTGIRNTVRRLELLYPGRHQLKQEKSATEYRSVLSIFLSK